MREIKFRAWDKKDNKVREVGAVHSNGDIHIKVPHGINDVYLRKDEFELMQFTGLLDKNGKEIYEGDIVQVERNKKKWEVTMRDFSWAFSNVNLKKDETWPEETYFFRDHLELWESANTTFEIIGNIYENADLIK